MSMSMSMSMRGEGGGAGVMRGGSQVEGGGPGDVLLCWGRKVFRNKIAHGEFNSRSKV